nr:MAG TPA: hypothetical protein [Caudoviricetes sp.]
MIIFATSHLLMRIICAATKNKARSANEGICPRSCATSVFS